MSVASTWGCGLSWAGSRLHASLVAVVAGLSVAPTAAGPATAVTSPAEVTASQRQLARWVAAFNGWRAAKHTWSGESGDEAELRRETRLLILPTTTPLLSGQRRLDGRAIVLSAGLVAVLDELLLAELLAGGPPGRDCFAAYGNRVLVVLSTNRDAVGRNPPGSVQAWPRLSTWIARREGDPVIYAPADPARTGPPAIASHSDEAVPPCRSITRAQLHSSQTQAMLAESTDGLAQWLFTHQSLQLAALPSLHPSKQGAVTSAAAAECQDRPGAAFQQVAAAKSMSPPVPIHVQVQLAIPTVAPCGTHAPSAVPTGVPNTAERSREAVTSSGRRMLQTTDWLHRHLWILTPPGLPPAAR